MGIKLKSLIMGTALVGTMVIGAGADASAAQVKVDKGDTLWGISKANNTSVNSLKKINKLSGDIIFPNQIIETSAKASPSKADKPSSNSSSTYTVTSGDTLWGISKANNVSVSSLKNWNNLSSDSILVNQKLSINGQEQNKGSNKSSESSKSSSKASNESNTSSKSSSSNNNKQEKVEKTEKPVEKTESNNQSGITMTVEATAYTAECYGCSGVTATGIDLNKDRNKKLIAVDPSVIPLGSKVHVEGYGNAIAGDTGGAIKGNRIDLHVPTKDEAFAFGRQDVKVTVLD